MNKHEIISIDIILDDENFLDQAIGWAAYFKARNLSNAKYPEASPTMEEAIRRDKVTHRLKKFLARKIDTNAIIETAKRAYAIEVSKPRRDAYIHCSDYENIVYGLAIDTGKLLSSHR